MSVGVFWAGLPPSGSQKGSSGGAGPLGAGAPWGARAWGARAWRLASPHHRSASGDLKPRRRRSHMSLLFWKQKGFCFSGAGSPSFSSVRGNPFACPPPPRPPTCSPAPVGPGERGLFGLGRPSVPPVTQRAGLWWGPKATRAASPPFLGDTGRRASERAVPGRLCSGLLGHQGRLCARGGAEGQSAARRLSSVARGEDWTWRAGEGWGAGAFVSSGASQR